MRAFENFDISILKNSEKIVPLEMRFFFCTEIHKKDEIHKINTVHLWTLLGEII